MASKFFIGDRVRSVNGESVVSGVEYVNLDGGVNAVSGYRLKGMSNIYLANALTPVAPPKKHRVVLEIEDPSALKALTGATIVSDTVI